MVGGRGSVDSVLILRIIIMIVVIIMFIMYDHCR